MNPFPTLVPFYLGASRSFVSRALSRSFYINLGDLECLLQVSITNELEFYASSIYRRCVLEILGVSYPISMIPIPMGDVCEKVRLDWLSRFGAMIGCKG